MPIELLPKKSDEVKKFIEEFRETADLDTIEGVVLLGYNSDGSCFLRTTSLNGEEKAYLLTFFQAFMIKQINEDI